MPIMKSCCCCGLRCGCIFVGIFSLVTSLAWAAWGGYNLHISGILQMDAYSAVALFHYGYAVGVGLWVFQCITSVVMIAGVCCDRCGLLIPYIVADVLISLVHCAVCAFYLYIMITALDGNYISDIFNLIALSLSAMFVVFDSLSLLCVISRYQELRYGEETQIIRQGSVVAGHSTSPLFGMTQTHQSTRQY